MERKLKEVEIPTVGKKYKYIGGGCDVHTVGETYYCEKISHLNSDNNPESCESYWGAPKFSENFVEVVEGSKIVERKLENELPVKGKTYKRITGDSLIFIKGNEYICEEDCKLKNIVWFNKDSFSQAFVEVVEEKSFESILKNPLTLEEVKFLKTLEEENERKLMFQEPVGVKHDQDKLPLYTIIFKQFPLAIQAVAKRALAGHNKYTETDADWQNFARAGEQDPDRYKNAGLRHLLEEGEDKEEGMEGTTHEAAVVWNFLADLELKIRRDEKLSK